MFTVTPADLQTFARDGFLRVPGLFAAEEIEPLRAACHADPSVRGSVVELADSNGRPQQLTCWTELGDDLLGIFPRIERLVIAAAALLGGEVYHWHSKLSLKPPHSAGRWDWHQDYPYWYKEGCLYPDMLTCTVAVDPATRENGCLTVLRGTHVMGRIDHVPIGHTTACDPDRLKHAMARHGLVACEMNPGDGLFFHANLLHTSGPNPTDSPRTLLHITYNRATNAPPVSQRPEREYRPLVVAPDDAIFAKRYRSAFANHPFPKVDPARTRSRYGQEIIGSGDQ